MEDIRSIRSIKKMEIGEMKMNKAHPKKKYKKMQIKGKGSWSNTKITFDGQDISDQIFSLEIKFKYGKPNIIELTHWDNKTGNLITSIKHIPHVNIVVDLNN